jgi:hypothetical protein
MRYGSHGRSKLRGARQRKNELKPIHQYPMGQQPNWVEIADLA